MIGRRTSTCAGADMSTHMFIVGPYFLAGRSRLVLEDSVFPHERLKRGLEEKRQQPLLDFVAEPAPLVE